VAHQVVGEDMAMALIKYQYRAKADDKPFSTWLVYVFRLDDQTASGASCMTRTRRWTMALSRRSAGIDIG
jgi:hypothetical protein